MPHSPIVVHMQHRCLTGSVPGEIVPYFVTKMRSSHTKYMLHKLLQVTYDGIIPHCTMYIFRTKLSVGLIGKTYEAVLPYTVPAPHVPG
jgi:hypothetical protein